MAEYNIDVETPRYVRTGVHLLPPEKFRDLTLTQPENKAAGLKAVKESLAHLQRELGVVKGMKLAG
jgi:hypothetical protein